jgi:hypothetical protein
MGGPLHTKKTWRLGISQSTSLQSGIDVGDGSHSWIAAGAEPDAHQFLCHDSF